MKREPFGGLSLWPLAALAASGGATDATTWLATKVFAANMTGNAVIAALALGAGDLRVVLPGAVALGSFFAGVVLGALLEARAHTAARRSAAAQNALWLEALLLVGFAYVLTLHVDAAQVRLAIATASLALGLQTAATHAAFGELSTTYRSGTLAALARSLASRFVPAGRRAGGATAAVWTVYVLAALAVGTIVARVPQARAAVPLACAALVTFVGIRNSAEEDALVAE